MQLHPDFSVDFIDMRENPDGKYYWILHTRDHFSKFIAASFFGCMEQRDTHVMKYKLHTLPLPPS